MVSNCYALMFNPDHIKGGVLQVAAIPLRDLQSRGFSVNRLSHVTPEFVNEGINRLLARRPGGEPRYSEGVARFSVQAVRSIQVDGRQVFVVIDTAFPDNVGHASIYSVRSCHAAKSGASDAREIATVVAAANVCRRGFRHVVQDRRAHRMPR